MRMMPIRYVRDMAACERFYGLLGLTVDARQRKRVTDPEGVHLQINEHDREPYT